MLRILLCILAVGLASSAPQFSHDADAVAVYFYLEVPESDQIPLNSFKESITNVIRKYNSSRGDQVLVTVTCGGGQYIYYGSVYSQLLRLNHQGIPWIAFIDQVGASGGYLAILGADQIYGNEHAMVGSIGVVIESDNIYEALNRQGIVHEIFTAGSHKRDYSSMMNNSADNLARLQDRLDYLHQQFIQTVELHRGDVMLEIARQRAESYCQTLFQIIPWVETMELFQSANSTDALCHGSDLDLLVNEIYLQHLRSVTQGDTWIGEDAIKVGLIDGIMTYEGYLDSLDSTKYQLDKQQDNQSMSMLEDLLRSV